ncbi:glycoside hydrolase family 130 protein [Cohnella sp. AR92]|uniref:glycoside hydrolase family 130 protein n=1 Tax=Cohnella sp. AR92 TaxID=648716 RepID=UPI000F8C51AA|nr:glycoside hydrolase family 130 protein [Cohnella sp. AR92]RUS46015.1 glycosidase [Cohnella sp. AR92]
MNIRRAEGNPIVVPSDVVPSSPAMEVIGVFNAGVARLGEEIILLLRVAERPIQQEKDSCLIPLYDPEKGETVLRSIPFGPENDFSDPRVIRTPGQIYLTSLSHLRVARSRDGLRFDIDKSPSIYPATSYETFGIEDPRITMLEDGYYIACTGVSPRGVVVPLLFTEDFRSFRRIGNIFHPDNKDVVLFPEKIGGKYYALHRPSGSHFAKPDIWIAESNDLLTWGNHRYLMGVREEEWDGGRIGASAVPIRTDRGWLELYHGADRDNRYCLGAVLLDLEEPWRVLARCRKPFLEPEEPFETEGFFGNVVFSCGALEEDGIVKIYYGAGDTSMGYAETTLESVLQSLQ